MSNYKVKMYRFANGSEIEMELIKEFFASIGKENNVGIKNVCSLEEQGSHWFNVRNTNEQELKEMYNYVNDQTEDSCFTWTAYNN